MRPQFTGEVGNNLLSNFLKMLHTRNYFIFDKVIQRQVNAADTDRYVAVP